MKSRYDGQSWSRIFVGAVSLALVATAMGCVRVPRASTQRDLAKSTAARETIAMFELALAAFELDTGRYPTAQEGLGVLSEAPKGPNAANWKGPYIRGAVPLDPWGHPYVYVAPSTIKSGNYDIVCYGSDGREGGSGSATDLHRPARQ